MATTMNPVDLYHDPSLDGLIHSSDSARRQTSNRRRSNGHDRQPVLEKADYIPPAPEVPRGPPVSYRGPTIDAGPQRSFSQRAKGRPYAKEAFADIDDYPAQAPVQQPRSNDETKHVPAPARGTEANDIHVNTKNWISEDTLMAREREGSARSATGPVPESQRISTQQYARRVSDSGRYRDPHSSAVSRSSAARDAQAVPSDQRRDWAPDRSPLQKLEVTLNDISKEEKRARVQEAEMLLRESKEKRVNSTRRSEALAAKTASSLPTRSTARREPQSSSQAPTIEDAGLVRNLSSTQRNRLQHSTLVDSHQPDPRRLSGEGRRGFGYSPSQSRPSEKAEQSTKSSLPPNSRDSAYTEGGLATRPQQKEHNMTSVHRSTSGRVPEVVQSEGVPSNVTRAVSMQQRQAPAHFPEDLSYQPSESIDRQRNASHKAALAKLTGASEPIPVIRNGSRKLQKAPAAETDRNRNRERDIGPTIVHQGIDRPLQPAPAAPKAHGSPPDPRNQLHTPPPRSREPVGLGVMPTAQASSPISTRIQPDGARPKQKTSSVTFKEPANRRPVDEWKDAQTARLSLADFALEKPVGEEKYKAWWEQSKDPNRQRRRRSSTSTRPDFARPADPIDEAHAEFNPRLFLRCGPLLRYLGMKHAAPSPDGKTPESEVWRGSILIVTQDSQSSYEQPPTLRLFSRPKALLPPPPAEITEELAPEYVDPIAGLTKLSRIGRPLYVRPVDHLVEEKDLSQVETDDGLFESSPSLADLNGHQGATTASTNNRMASQDGEHVGRYQEVQGARLYADPDRDVTFWRFSIEVELGGVQQHIVYRINRGATTGFWVPARGQTMNIMFHSCNGFSLSVNPNQFSGPDPLWRDVLNVHQTRPFHVMIGGGDQIYNDRVLHDTRYFAEWSKTRNPATKHEAPFTPEMKEELESFYLNRYAMWFSQGLFAMAGSQIPMVNIWDDHDIIDGFGSYPDHFMKVPVFSGIGNIAFKYYMLFQHQSVAEETAADEPSWVLGHEPGPYIHQLSRNIFMKMGRHVAFLGIDCRTERMRDEILSIRSFDLLLEKCRKELVEGETKHLIVLLGVPIAYPRLVWLENVLTSRAMDPIKALGRAGVFKGGFLNKFDGGVEVLDDLDDHWTASRHKSERNDLIRDLQDLAAEKSVRITILGGDVHLAAIGQFHSNPKLKIPKDRDHRYMPNVISSAIVNTPPPDMLADILNKRNKTHHLDKYTDETMIPMFTHDVDHRKRNNNHLLPRRNWCSIREYIPGSTPPPSPPSTPSVLSDEDEHHPETQQQSNTPRRRFSLTKDDVNPRALLRRLSSRRAPPSSYRDGNTGQMRSASYDGAQTARIGGMFGTGQQGSGSQRASLDSQVPTRRASSFDHTSSGAPIRPGMLRRPTNLSEKAARKGNVPAVDADGNEIDVNDHVNLEGGLDVVLNVEVNQKDPAGITTPYRLLIPALWYDGSSDREKLTSAADVHRKPTLLNRFGIGPRRNQKAAQNQGQGNWGQEMSDSESYADSDDMQKLPPRRRFSLFGSRRRNKEESYSDDDYDEGEGHATRPGFAQPPQHTNAVIRQVSAPLPQAQPHQSLDPHLTQSQQMRPTQAHGHDALYDTTNRPPPGHGPMSAAEPPIRRSLTITSQKNRNAAAGSAPRSSSGYYPTQHQQQLPPAPANATPSSTAPSAYERQNQYQFDSPPSHPPAATTIPQHRRSKQERVLGIGSDTPMQPNNGQIPPQGGQLRGNGIIGNSNAFAGGQGQGEVGYGGIEAWREPSAATGRLRKGFSLKKARNWLGGRREEDEDEDEEYEDEGGGRSGARRMY